MKIKYENQYYIHFCLGCNKLHYIPNFDGRPHWGFNNNYDAPTFSPSVKHTFRNKDVDSICHYFITDGKIKYCSDCFHSMSGQTVSLPDL